MNTLYRIAAPRDAEALARLNALFNGPGCQTVNGIRAALITAGTETVFVAERSGVLVGFLCGQQLNSFCYLRPTIEFTELYIAAQARREGIASSLMAFAENWYKARGASEFHLLTGTKNDGARAFYTRMGYRLQSEVLYAKQVD